MTFLEWHPKGSLKLEDGDNRNLIIAISTYALSELVGCRKELPFDW